MKKLHVKISGEWLPVFCHMDSRIMTCPNSPEKALPSRAAWADQDLRFFNSKFANLEFCLMDAKREAKG